MNLKPFLFFKIKKIISIELFYENAEMQINSFVLKNKKGELNIEEISIVEIDKHPLPIVLNISIKDIIFKSFNTENEANSFLSSFEMDDFYFQQIQTKKTSNYNLIRREKLNEIILESGIDIKKIVAINLGGALLINHLSRMSVLLSGLEYGPHYFKLADEIWYYSLNEKSYGNQMVRILDEEFAENQLLPLISGIHYLNTAQKQEFLNCDSILNNSEKVIFNFNSKQILRPSVLCVSALLCIHFLLNLYLQKKKSGLQIDQEKVLNESELLQNLRAENEELKNSLNSSGKTYPIPLSYLLDRIAGTNSHNIQFDRLLAFPVIKNQRQEKRPDYHPNQILLMGSSKNHSDLSNWLSELKQVPFLESKAHNSILRNNKESIDFELQLNLKP